MYQYTCNILKNQVRMPNDILTEETETLCLTNNWTRTYCTLFSLYSPKYAETWRLCHQFRSDFGMHRAESSESRENIGTKYKLYSNITRCLLDRFSLGPQRLAQQCSKYHHIFGENYWFSPCLRNHISHKNFLSQLLRASTAFKPKSRHSSNGHWYMGPLFVLFIISASKRENNA